MKDATIERHITDLAQARRLYDDQRAIWTEERGRLYAERDAARANFLAARDARDAAIIERDAVAAVLDDLMSERDRYRRALIAVRLDIGQDRLEDPIGFEERASGGFYRIAFGAVDAVDYALKGTT